MTDLRKAAEEAAKVLANALSIDFNDKRDWYSYKHDVEYAANLLCQALAQPEQEHKPWCDYLNIMLTSLPPQKAKCNCKQAQPEQKPVEVMQALADNDCAIAYADGWNACVRAHKHTAPPKHEWVGLTDDDIENLWNGVQWSISDFVIPFTRAVEAKLEEKNA